VSELLGSRIATLIVGSPIAAASDAPLQVLPLGFQLSGRRRFRAALDLPREGTYTWSVDSGLSVEPDGHEVGVVLLEETQEGSPVTLRCQFNGAAGDTLDAELPFHWRPGLMGLVEGEAIPEAWLPSGAGGAESTGLPTIEEYEGVSLETPYEIHQDKGDSDCGPACVVFLRAGGEFCVDQPEEAGQQFTGGTVQAMCDKMREETNAPASSLGGTVNSHIVNIANEFASVFQGERCSWTETKGSFDISRFHDFAEIQSFTDHLRQWVPAIGESPVGLSATLKRGVVVPMMHTGEEPQAIPGEDPDVKYWPGQRIRMKAAETDPEREARIQISGTSHYVVAVAMSADHVLFFDPAEDTGLARQYPTSDFLFAHLWSRQGMFGGGSATVSSGVVHAVETPQVEEVQSGEPLGEFDADGLGVIGQTINTTSGAIWFNNWVEADQMGRLLADNGKNAMVLEVPAGCFAVVECAEIDEDIVEDGELDDGAFGSSESDYLIRQRYTLASMLMFLKHPTSGETIVRWGRWTSKTHRPGRS
jgi:hypothetical protein